MDGSIRLSTKERKVCVKAYRSARTARRALVLLLLDDEQSYRRIREATLVRMVRGEQAEVVTPGNNEKRHLAGSLHWRTGRLLLSAPARRRNAALFIAHLDDLRRQLRGYGVIHVICDNARFHYCRAVREFLMLRAVQNGGAGE